VEKYEREKNLTFDELVDAYKEKNEELENEMKVGVYKCILSMCSLLQLQLQLYTAKRLHKAGASPEN